MMSRSNLGWLAGYLLVLAAVTWLVVAGRQWAVARLDNDTARAEREKYLESVRHEAEEGSTVQRKIPTTSDPPELVMLRDRFWVVMAAGWIFASLFYGFAMYVARGMQRTSATALPDVSHRS